LQQFCIGFMRRVYASDGTGTLRTASILIGRKFSRQTGLVLWEKRGLLGIECEFTLSSIRNDCFVGTTLFWNLFVRIYSSDGQSFLFPMVLDDFVPVDHVCRVIDAFVNKLVMSELGFERAKAAETGRPGYDPRDLLKLYLYGYLNQVRSSRRLESECRRNVELMWLLGRLYPDHKSIAEFRRMHREAVTAAGAELVRFAKSCGLIRGEWIAIDGSKFRAVASIDSARERLALQRYLDSIEYYAVSEIEVGPPESAYRGWLQTAVCC
jgi:transposase